MMNSTRKTNKFIRGQFFKSIATLASGSLIAQIITLLSSPIMTRLFTPEEIGLFTLFTTIISVLSPILSLRYDFIIVTEEDENDVITIIQLCVFICLILSFSLFLIYLIYFLFKYPFLYAFSLSVFIFVLLLCAGLINVLVSYNNRYKEYKLMTSVYVIKNVIQCILMILFGLMNFGSTGLILSQTIAQFAGMKKQAKSLLKSKGALRSVNKTDIKRIAMKYKQQPFIHAPASILNSFCISAPNYCISLLYGNLILGFYSLSYRALSLPLSLVSNNVSKVFFESASNEYNETGGFEKSLHKTMMFLLPISICMLVCLIALSVPLFKFVFGSDWSLAGRFVQILSPLFSVRLICSTISISTVICNKQKFDLRNQIILTCIIGFDLSISKFFNFSVEEFLMIYSLLGTAFYIYWIIAIFMFSKKRSV